MMNVVWSLLVALWLGLQVWYWTALRTVEVLISRQATLTEEERGKWQEWLRRDKPYDRWWRPVLGSLIVFPIRAVTLFILCSIQLVIVTICSPFRRRHGSRLRRSSGLQMVWQRNFVRSIVTALTWAELRCLGVKHVQEYEVLNVDFERISNVDAGEKIRTRRLNRVECNALDEPRNYVSNHVSYVDIVLYIALLYPSFCSKASVASMPMVGDTAKWLDCIFMRRSDAAERKRVLNIIQMRQRRVWRAATCFRNVENQDLIKLVEYRRSLTSEDKREGSNTLTAGASNRQCGFNTRCTTADVETADDNPIPQPNGHKFDDDVSYETTPALLVFPEGTTSNGQFLLPFKRGAFAAMKPVSPIVLVYDCPWFNMSYETIPIVWLYPVLAGCWDCCSVRIYWLREMCPTVDQTLARDVSGYTQSVRDAMGKVLLAVSNSKPSVVDDTLNHRWTGDLEAKRACIKRLFT